MDKNIYQLFIGKVSDRIGNEKTMELLRESKKAFEGTPKPKSHDFSLSGATGDFEDDLYKLINIHCENGLKKPDLIKKMQYVTGGCMIS